MWESRRDMLIVLMLVTVAVALYLPAIDWGAPRADAPGTTRAWGPDEIGPLGPLSQLAAWFGAGEGDPQYPLFHYIVVALCDAPYLILLMLTGRMAHPHAGYPFGFKDAAAGIHGLLVIARVISLLMAAGIVVAALFTGKTLWGRRAGILSAIFVLLMLPMFYYARTSNVDVPALFWVSLVILLFARAITDGLTLRRAIWLGVFASLAVATKDQNYTIVLPLLLALFLGHFRFLHEHDLADFRSRLKTPLACAGVSAGVYAIASGFVLNPAKFHWHVAMQVQRAQTFVTVRHPHTLGGQVGLWHEALSQVIRSTGWPVFAAASLGILICFIRRRAVLWLLLPFLTLYLGFLAPFGYVEIRYVMIWSYILALFAGFAILVGFESPQKPVKAAALLWLLAGCGLELMGGADLTYLMLRDSRYEAARWIDTHVRSGDDFQYFRDKATHEPLPRTGSGVVWSNFWTTRDPAEKLPKGEFVFLMGPTDLENHRNCPEWLYKRLKNGSLGYQLVAKFETRPLFSSLTSSLTSWAKVSNDSAVTWSSRSVSPYSVNPLIEIYARRDVAQRLASSGATSRFSMAFSDFALSRPICLRACG